MLWSEKDSINLSRIADALEEFVGKKRFIPTTERLNIELVSGEEAEDELKKEEEKHKETRDEVMQKNPGKHLWEETNVILAEASEDYESGDE